MPGGAGGAGGARGMMPMPGMPGMGGAGTAMGFGQGAPGMMGGGESGVLTTNFRSGDHFTSRHQEGSLIITATGTVTDGKVKVSKIRVVDGRDDKSYESLDRVPEEYQDKAKSLLEMNEKTNSKLEVKPLPKKGTGGLLEKKPVQD
jgi:hypothetical protein